MKRFESIRIAFLTPEYPHGRTPGLCGGIGTSIMNLAHAMRKAGATVSIIIYGQDADEAFEENGIAHYRVQSIEKGKLRRYYTQKKIERLIRALVRQHKVNVVEAPDWRGATSFISANCPIVVKLHGSETYFAHLDQRPLKWRIRYTEKRALQKADAVISVSAYAAQVTQDAFGMTRTMTVVPNGIDVDRFKVSNSETPFNILYFGTLVRKKGSLELSAIFNQVVTAFPSATLTLVGLDSNDPATGNASVWNMIQSGLSAQARASTTYEGAVAYEKVRGHIAAASVCIFPSYAEALPVSWIEAMAMGKAIVASDIGWAREMIEDGKEGYLVHPANHALFAERIGQLLTHEERRAAFGRAARAKAETRFSIDTVAIQNLEFYHQLIPPK